MLSVSRLVNVAINLSPLAAARRNFGVLLCCGDSNVISGLERIRDYTDISGVTADFGTTAPETLAATNYFGQTPKPAKLSIGRWIRTATAAILNGSILNSTQQALINFTAITAGGFNVTVDGVVKALTGLDFSAALNLNGVASAITTALAGSATCVWNGSRFAIMSATTGVGVAANGGFTLTGNPANGNTISVAGTTVTFVTAGPTGNQVLIGATAADTATNLNTFLSASTDVNLITCSYSVLAAVVSVASKTVGVAGNSIAITKVGANITVSGATLAGGLNPSSVSYATAPGSGTDISLLLGLTSAVASPLVPGYAAETPLACAAAMTAKSTAWYGLMFAASTQPTDDQNIAVCSFIEAQSITRIFGVTITNTNAIDSTVTNDLGSRMMAGGYEQSFCQYSQNPYAIASYFGRAFSVDFNANRSTINLMFKQEPGIAAEDLTETQANTLQAKRINVFVKYVNNTNIIQYGVMSGPAWFDEIHGLDWFQDAVQNACYNLMYTSTTKIPQTDAGVNQFVTAISGVCDQAVTNGLVAPGTWNADGFGQLVYGQFLKTGYYIFAQPIALQSQSDRDTRVAPPIQTALKLAGAIQGLDVLVSVNR